MIRFKFIYAPQTRDFVLEMRVNPIQVVAHVKKLIKLTEYVLGSFPDLSIEPPEETKIFIPEVQLPVEKKKKKRRKRNKSKSFQKWPSYKRNLSHTSTYSTRLSLRLLWLLEFMFI